MSVEFEEQILRSLRRISRAIDVHSKKLANEYHLTTPQLVCLRVVAHNEVTTPSVLAREVSLSQATITGILDRLEIQGFVMRERATDDRRKVYIRITSKGEEVVETAPVPLQQKFSRRLSSLSEEDRERIASVLESIVDMMEADEIEAAPLLAVGPMTAESSDVVDFLEDPDTEDGDQS